MNLFPLIVVWSLAGDVQAPECCYYDPAGQVLYVSQYGTGGPSTKDSDGRISRISLDGKVLEADWVTGLGAPKGMRSSDQLLWVTDIDELLAIDKETGKIARRVAVEGAKGLNDVAIGPDGEIYVSDISAGAIYRHHNGNTEVFVTAEEVGQVNGLLVDGDDLILGGWARAKPSDPSVKLPGQLMRVNLKTKQMTPITGDLGNLDGVESDGQGGFYVTDIRAGKLYHIGQNGSVADTVELKPGCADLARVPEKKLLVIPFNRDNTLTAFQEK